MVLKLEKEPISALDAAIAAQASNPPAGGTTETTTSPPSLAVDTKALLGTRFVSDEANVRATPSRAGKLSVGDRITVDRESGDHAWLHVTFPGGNGWVLARVLAKSTTPPPSDGLSTAATPNINTPAALGVLAACPGPVASFDIEAHAGKYNPPALLAPSSDNGQSGSHLRSEWDELGGQDVVLHCHPKSAPQSVVDVALPSEATRCVSFHDQLTCYRK